MAQVIFTAPNGEFKAAARLERLGHRSFVPLGRTKKQGLRPLFPRYIMAWLDPTLSWRQALTSGWISYMLTTPSGEPQRLGDSAIDELRERMACDGGAVNLDPPPEPIKIFRPNQPIRVVGGAYTGFDGFYQSRAGDRIAALLTMFNGRAVHATVQERFVA